MSNNKNMVDERFELVSVIFRLAGSTNYGHLETDYQKEVAEKFAKFADHPAVKLIKSFDGSNGVWVGYHCTLQFIAHLEKEKKDGKFVFIEDINSMFNDGNWNETAATDFLTLFNNFYADANYADFFNSKITYFEEVTQKFVDETYSKIDFEWFRKYVDPANLRCIYSLSSGNYAATVNNKIVYSLVFKDGGAIIHEFCHSFADKLADKWYEENQEFKKWCDDSIDMEKMPYYGNGTMMAHEYVTRAYNILYCCQSNGAFFENGISYKISEVTPFLVLSDFKNGFPYIKEVYAMILKLENK